MADGVEITAGSGTTVATDDVGGSQYQRIKVCWGADGNANDTSAAAPLPIVFSMNYELVGASATAQVLGTTGATGDFIAGVLIIPITTSPGAVSLVDLSTATAIFMGGASSLSNLVPFYVPLNMVSQFGPWKLTTGTNVYCIATGRFT